ncbi:dTDP-4-dehydrorhamnose reductase [Candidatus Micrarchaeota archaeon]|nr:dTDP-4-dehydrorhamnose reductase [Candidatus Micrarchaeota archaeon]
MKRIFLTGGEGLLGSRIVQIEGYETLATCFENVELVGKRFVFLDIRRKQDVFNAVSAWAPDAVIHAAALTNVDYCEEHPRDAEEINAFGTANVAEAAERVGAKMVYVSTDYVFDGEKGMYCEDDEPKPINTYAKTKLQGEEWVKRICSNYAIARTSVLYGWSKNKLNYASWLVGELEASRSVNIVVDQWASPTLADNLADALLFVCNRDLKGFYHIAGSDRASRFEFAQKLAEAFGFDKNLIRAVSSSEIGWKAKRPPDSSLNISKIQREGFKMLNVGEGLSRMKETRGK